MPRRESPLDAGDGALSRFAVELRKLREQAGSPTYRELSRAAHYSATVLSEAAGGRKLPTLAVTLAYVRACEGDPDQWQDRWQQVAAELSGAAPPLPRAPEQPAPYVGLGAFQSTDADRFFGRERLVGELLARVRDRRLLGVFGASGSGKSSLLRAGLVAEVAAGGGRTLVITPGPHPLEECALHLAPLTGEPAPGLHAELAEDPANLHLVVRQALLGESEDAELLLVVDQFEEVFTVCTDPAERTWFIAALVHAAQAATSRTRVVLGVRADFYGHCGQHPDLVEALRDGQLLVGPMTAEELRQAVTAPAVRAGCTVETALVSRLIADATGQAGVLPLVSHALLETWHRRRGTRLTLEGYQETGGIQHAVSRTADQVFSGLDPAGQRVARQLFLRLTALGEGTEDTKRRIRREELDPESEPVLRTLADARLLTLDRDSVEIAHEALIRSWPRLRGWLTEDRDALRVHRQLGEATDSWRALDRDPGALYRGTRLALARDFAAANGSALTVREREFLEASLAAEAAEQATARRRAKRLRQLVALLTVLLLMAVTAVVYAVNTQRTATEQRNIAVSRKAIGDAAAMRAGNPALSLQLSLAVYELVPNQESRDNLLSSLSTDFGTRLTGFSGDLSYSAFSPNGKVAAAVSLDRTARLWDVTDIHRPRELATIRQADPLVQLAFTADGRTMVTVGGGSARLWDVTDPASPRESGLLDGHGKNLTWVAFRPDGRLAVASVQDGPDRLFDLSDPAHPVQLPAELGRSAPFGQTAFGADGHLLAAVDGSVVRLWDLSDPAAPVRRGVLAGHVGTVASLAFSPDGHTVGTGGWDHQSRLWDVSDPAAPRGLATLTGQNSIVWGVGFSPDGHTFATTGDLTVRLWDLADRAHPRLSNVVSGGVYSVAFSPDSNRLLVTDDERAVRLTNLRELPMIGHENFVSSVQFSPNGHLLASGSWDGTVRLTEVTDPRSWHALPTLTDHTGYVRAVEFSRDGTLLATGSDDGTAALWNLRDPEHPVKVGSVQPKSGEVDSLSLRADGRVLATGTEHGVVLWDISDPKNPRELSRPPGYTVNSWAVVFSPDGKTLATENGDPKSLLWDVTDPSNPRRLPFPLGSTESIPVRGFSPNGNVLATVRDDGLVRLVDMTDRHNPRELSQLTGHTRGVYDASFSTDGNRLVTSSADKTVRVWDVSDPRAPRLLETLSGHTLAVATSMFSPDGHTVVSGSNDGTVRLWDTDVNEVEARICAVAYPRITPEEWARYLPDIDYRQLCPL
ncbi:hypothetical protein GCM10010174_18690 [Kutzneria viridogrisea]|uniref:WD40 repeat protein n=1 Tax=Kutzneria viridogrisea TaxID=47990 RepID=A0ABR6B7P1_9PSEU|nr:WD40 repeat protein [Kutzneria viridogrisea]